MNLWIYSVLWEDWDPSGCHTGLCMVEITLHPVYYHIEVTSYHICPSHFRQLGNFIYCTSLYTLHKYCQFHFVLRCLWVCVCVCVISEKHSWGRTKTASIVCKPTPQNSLHAITSFTSVCVFLQPDHSPFFWVILRSASPYCKTQRPDTVHIRNHTWENNCYS